MQEILQSEDIFAVIPTRRPEMNMTIRAFCLPFWIFSIIVLFVSNAGAWGDESESFNMQLVGKHPLQGRSSYQPIPHKYGDRWILFVGHHAGESLNTQTGELEVNGMSVLDITDATKPELLSHVPPTSPASGTQHVQVCDGSSLPEGNPDKTYLLRTNGLLSYELFDVTDPAEPKFLSTIAETGHSSRPESSRGTRETHKFQWECITGIAYFNGTPKGWRVTRLLQAFDLSNPNNPHHIRDFGLIGWEPGAQDAFPDYEISGLHQPFIVGNRMFLGYGSGNNGVLQILNTEKFLKGNPSSGDPFEPTPENLLYPQIARLDMPSYWGVHTAKPIYDIPAPEGSHHERLGIKDLLIVVSEAGRDARRCQATPDVMFLIDITEEATPFPISSFQVPAQSGDFCERGGRFGPHSVHDAFHPKFDKTLVILSYFNAGIRVVDIRDPFQPVEVGYFIPETTSNTVEDCITINETEHCNRAIQTNNVNIDDRGFIYAVDRANTGLHIVELTGTARSIPVLP